jgi:CBS domain containing-hemolysin-like protein
MKYIKIALIILSIALNALFVFTVVSAFTVSAASLSFYDMDEGGKRYTTAAAVVSIPLGAAEVLYGPVALSLAAGDKASLQISAVSGGKQANRIITALYDRSVIRVSETGFGIVITALAPGSTALQTLSGEGIIDIAVITVTGRE